MPPEPSTERIWYTPRRSPVDRDMEVDADCSGGGPSRKGRPLKRLGPMGRHLPGREQRVALIYELARAGLIEAWVSSAILEEYADLLGDHPKFVAEIVESFPGCYPLTELSLKRAGQPFPECALYRERPIHRHRERSARTFRSEAISGSDCGKALGRQGSASPLRVLYSPRRASMSAAL